MIRTGAAHAQIVGCAATPSGPIKLGIDIAAGGVSLRAGGRDALGAAALAEILPVQAIHADIGGVVQGPPEARRRLIDWGVFHVEQGFLADWRTFRRALQQRNALLRSGAADELFPAWDQALATAAAAVDDHRRRYLARLEPAFTRIGHRLLGMPVGLSYVRGWPADGDLLAILATSRDGDRALGYTRSGPGRADIQFEINETRSRWRASKGQQKLLAAAVILAQLELLTQATDRSAVLLVDEPAADLDAQRLADLMGAIEDTQSQVFVAAIIADGLPISSSAALFHVEHGCAKALL
jgi:DNA replication and repair protein RecF